MVKPTENEALSVGGMDQPEDSQSVMVSLEMKGPHHAGTLFVNPLFEPKLMGAEKHVERTPNLYRLCCQLALFEGTNVSGPLFRVGSEFECMRLPGHKDSLAYFENKWGLDCSPAPIHLFASANRRSWLHYDAEESNLTNAINCTIPTHSNNEFVHVLCAAAKVFHYGPPFEDTFLWDCFRETLFFSETKYFKCFLNDLL